ncbi:MAG: hypothetical protein FJX30_00825 [Alphaproteobacteria bacterium]|nr:hypothetical protein [Alphaproteobacteria bacterium]
MKITKILILPIIILSIQSCSIKNIEINDVTSNIDCHLSVQEITIRKNLFNILDSKEIKRREKINLPSVTRLDEESSVSKIVEAIKNSPKNSKFIVIDLRNYKEVDLTNIIFSNESDFTLTPYLYTSKYSQGFFSIININEDSITVMPPEILKFFKTHKIYRPDLIDSEIIINASNSKSIFGNLKFAKNIKFSLIADNIKEPSRLDMREASNMQFNLNRKWIMPVYSIENSQVNGSKITTVFMMHINNKNSIVNLNKFYKSTDKCYIDESNKFNIKNK